MEKVLLSRTGMWKIEEVEKDFQMRGFSYEDCGKMEKGVVRVNQRPSVPFLDHLRRK